MVTSTTKFLILALSSSAIALPSALTMEQHDGWKTLVSRSHVRQGGFVPMNQRSVHQDSHAETLQKRKSKWDVLEEFDLDKHYSAELFEWLISSILRDKGIDPIDANTWPYGLDELVASLRNIDIAEREAGTWRRNKHKIKNDKNEDEDKDEDDKDDSDTDSDDDDDEDGGNDKDDEGEDMKEEDKKKNE